jgi:putative peptidoglycan lipid II flippase
MEEFFLEKNTNKTIAGAAAIVMLSIVLSRLTGFVRETLVPNLLGFESLGASYTMAFKITGFMYDLLVGGAIAAALIPILSGYIAKDNEKEGWKSISTFVNTLIVLTIFACCLGIIFAPQLVKINAPGFTDPKQFDTTVKLVRLLFPSVALLMFTGLTNGVLNSYKRFIASAFGPTIYNIGCSISIIIFGRNNQNIEEIAYGIILTSFFYFLLQFILAFKNLKHYRFIFDFKNPDFIKLFKLAIPSLMSSSIVQINILIISSFATTLGDASVVATNAADRIWQMPYGIFAQGLGIAMLPSISAMSALGEVDNFKKTVKNSLKFLSYIIVPCALIFITSGTEVISTLFSFTSKFNTSNIILTSNILTFFSFAMISQSMVAILNRAFYAKNDTITPLMTGLSTVVVILSMCFIFTGYTNLMASGLALSYTIASIINAVLLYMLLVRKIGSLEGNFKIFGIKTTLASIITIMLLHAANVYIFQAEVSKLFQLIRLSIVCSVVFCAYFSITLLLKQDEAIYFKNILLSKLVRNKVKGK